MIPPTPGLDGREVALSSPLKLASTSIRQSLSVALNTSSGFGGVNAAVVIRRRSSLP
jgi:3-oxoacyl-(acyl-carrier-protein) synthase